MSSFFTPSGPGHPSYCIFLDLLSAFPIKGRHCGFPSQVVPIFCILLRHFNLSHVLLHHIHKTVWPFPLSWQLRPQHPSPDMPVICPPYTSIVTSIPPWSRLSCFLVPHLRCPSDVLIPDLDLLLLCLMWCPRRLVPNSCGYVLKD